MRENLIRDPNRLARIFSLGIINLFIFNVSSY